MNKDELRSLYETWKSAEANVDSLGSANTSHMTPDESFELDIRYRAALRVYARAKNAYTDAAEKYAEAQ